MIDLGKWSEKTAQAVRHICNKKQSFCIGFGLAFFDPMAKIDEQYSFNIHLAFDPNNPPEEKERLDIEKSLEYILEGVTHIMNGESFERGKIH